MFKQHRDVSIFRNINHLNKLLIWSSLGNYTTWLAEIKLNSGACAWESVKNQGKLPLLACKWFVNKEKDTNSLQKAVLGKNFQQSYCSNCDTDNNNATNNTNKLRILIIDREGDTRKWAHSRSTCYLIKLLYQSLFDVRFIPNLKSFSLYDQALAIHTSDIIITSHGAQLTNIAYIKKCTAVIELFPKNYYLYFYQLMTLVAGGIHFEGYEFGFNRWKDTSSICDVPEKRSEARAKTMLVSPESLVLELPRIVSAILDCRSKCCGR